MDAERVARPSVTFRCGERIVGGVGAYVTNEEVRIEKARAA